MSELQKGFIVYGDIEPLLNRLSNEEAGKLLKGMVGYFNHGIDPDFDDRLELAFIPIQQQMDRNKAKYEKKCARMRENASKRWGDVNESDSMQLHPNASKSMQMHPNASKSMQMHPIASNCIQLQANASNTDTNTNTDTDTKTDTDTDTTTNTNTNTNTNVCGGGVCDGNEFDIRKRMSGDDYDRIYEVYPNSAGDLIDVVAIDVKDKKKDVRDPVAYILGTAPKIGWVDTVGGGN